MTNQAFDMPLLPHMIVDGLNRYDDRPCLVMGEQEDSYREVREKTSQFIQVLQSKGLGKGSRVAILSLNRPEVLYNLCAMQVNGCCGTALHPLGSLEDHAYVMNDAEIDALVYDAAVFDQHVSQLKGLCPNLKHLLAFGPSEVADDYIELSRQYEPQPLKVADIRPDDIGSIVYTGGTTGRPKGVLHPYRVAAYMTLVQMAEWEFPEELRMMIATPLSHAAAAFFVPTLQKGGAFYVPSGFSADEYFDMIEQHRITATMLVPVMVYMLLDSPRADTADMSSLETLFYGASPMNPSRLREGVEKWGQIFYQVYGQSEAPMVLANMYRKDHDLSRPERFSSCGRPASWVHLKLLDEEGREVAPGEPGEICVRGPLVMEGYHNLPEQTAETLKGGWLHTGDVGRFDEDGFLYIVDRTKDMIVTGGFNVFPKEVEDVLGGHEQISQVCVIGVPDERWGEAVKAVIVLKPGIEASDELEEEMKSMVKEAKGSVQAPKSIDFVEAIPLTAVGKPDKKAVRASYWEGQERQV